MEPQPQPRELIDQAIANREDRRAARAATLEGIAVAIEDSTNWLEARDAIAALLRSLKADM